MQFSAIKSNVLSNLIDTPTTIQNQAPDLVKNAHRTLMRRHNFYIMQSYFEQATVASTRALKIIPSDWKQPFKRPFYKPQYGAGVPIIWAQETEIAMRYNATDEGAPVALTDDGTNINVWPLSDGYADTTDGQYVIRVPYFKYLPALSADSDEDWFCLNAFEFIEWQATADGFAKNWDESHSTYWQARADKKFLELVNADKARWLGSLDTFAPQRGALGPRTQL